MDIRAFPPSPPDSLDGRRVLIIGLGESGIASARWCLRAGARVTIIDSRNKPPALDELMRRGLQADFHVQPFDQRFDSSLLAGCDLVVLSPGVSPGILPIVHARAAGIPVVGEIELFARALRGLQPWVPLVAITGTNGKTTTTALTGHLLAATGKRVAVAGNISPAALAALCDACEAGQLPEAWVLELSSFQLETTETLAPTAATVLNVSDDHLDRYRDLEEYAAVKARIFRQAQWQVLNRGDARVKAMALAGKQLISFGLDAPAMELDFGIRARSGKDWLVQGERFLLPLAELPLAGLHNAQNAMAALALCHALGFDALALAPALRTFQGLPHRVEKIAEIDGVVFYDDSKGTNVGATCAALSGLRRTVVLILGGEGKQQDFSPLAPFVAAHARGVALIGKDAAVIHAALKQTGVPLYFAQDLEDAVRWAANRAHAGDAVLLSPACASFDMFRNYEHRAEVFRAAVARLSGKAGA
ncbi:MAG: UDP-N-acetylmuramoyl-L-alanine--D-glutamate ligase [Rhodocyclaceae bacterium]|nr:UDP-N-acetylmuramoyl-L-alanine--D-glutamate ligase [Rhodocyclaceae bacterium]